MPRTTKLKVYRTPIGFHDAYVAAPSQKAAIEAWGSDKDVFQRGRAELVTDPELTKEPLANPGKVIKRLRGTEAEQIAALGETGEGEKRTNKSAKAEAEEAEVKPARKTKEKPPPKPKPRPSRAKLDETEQALGEAEARYEVAMKALREREATLARERKELEKQEAEREGLKARRDKAEAAYAEALRRWRQS